jgi:hypothetical protein
VELLNVETFSEHWALYLEPKFYHSLRCAMSVLYDLPARPSPLTPANHSTAFSASSFRLLDTAPALVLSLSLSLSLCNHYALYRTVHSSIPDKGKILILLESSEVQPVGTGLLSLG